MGGRAECRPLFQAVLVRVLSALSIPETPWGASPGLEGGLVLLRCGAGARWKAGHELVCRAVFRMGVLSSFVRSGLLTEELEAGQLRRCHGDRAGRSPGRGKRARSPVQLCSRPCPGRCERCFLVASRK